MGPMVVVVGEPAREPRPQFASGFEGVEIDALVFHRLPEALDEDVVHPAAPARLWDDLPDHPSPALHAHLAEARAKKSRSTSSWAILACNFSISASLEALAVWSPPSNRLAMLGHADLKTTEIYTQVSIKALKAVHTATHPAKPIRSRLAAGRQGASSDASEAVEALLAALYAEDEGEAWEPDA